MKQRCALFLTLLLLCMTLAPALLAADAPFITSDVESSSVGSPTESISIPNETILLEQVTPSMFTVTPSAIMLTSFDEPYRTDAMAFPVGTSQAELLVWFADVNTGFIGYDAQGNSYDLMAGPWSLSGVDTATSGSYYASAVPDFGEDYTVAEGVSLPRQLNAVSIQTPGEPDINCCVSARGFLHFPWVLSSEQQEQLDAFAVWLRRDNGEWTKLSSGFCFTSEDLQLSLRIFASLSTYDLKVIYPGGQTGVLTFEYDGELSIIDYSGGDRDGGDVNGGGLVTGSQPASTPPQPPSPSQDSDDHNNSDNTPTLDNASPVSNEITSEPVSTPDEAQQKQAPVSAQPVFITLTTPINSTPTPSKATLNPIPDSTDNSSTELVESYSPLQTVISGLRLHDLCVDEESVVFGSGDLTVSIPSKVLLALNLSDSDSLWRTSVLKHLPWTKNGSLSDYGHGDIGARRFGILPCHSHPL